MWVQLVDDQNNVSVKKLKWWLVVKKNLTFLIVWSDWFLKKEKEKKRKKRCEKEKLLVVQKRKKKSKNYIVSFVIHFHWYREYSQPHWLLPLFSHPSMVCPCRAKERWSIFFVSNMQLFNLLWKMGYLRFSFVSRLCQHIEFVDIFATGLSRNTIDLRQLWACHSTNGWLIRTKY